MISFGIKGVVTWMEYCFRYLLMLIYLYIYFGIFVGKLEAMILEAKGSWAEAEKAYSSLLEDNPLDQVSSFQVLYQMSFIFVGMIQLLPCNK